MERATLFEGAAGPHPETEVRYSVGPEAGVRAAGRRGAGAPPAEGRLEIEEGSG